MSSFKETKLKHDDSELHSSCLPGKTLRDQKKCCTELKSISRISLTPKCGERTVQFYHRSLWGGEPQISMLNEILMNFPTSYSFASGAIASTTRNSVKKHSSSLSLPFFNPNLSEQKTLPFKQGRGDHEPALLGIMQLCGCELLSRMSEWTTRNSQSSSFPYSSMIMTTSRQIIVSRFDESFPSIYPAHLFPPLQRAFKLHFHNSKAITISKSKF